LKKVFDFVLDTLQIFFPWDDDLYTFLKNRGFASKKEFKALPLVYTDDCESTTGKPEIPRNYIIDPEKFGENINTLGWKIQLEGKKKRYVIPAEKILLRASIKKEYLEFAVIPTVNGKEQYHLEYSVMSAFGKGYANWSTFYFKIKEFESFVSRLREEGFGSFGRALRSGFEEKQNQREEFRYVELPVKEYCFNLAGFRYAEAYLQRAGYTGKIPGLFFDASNPGHLKLMEPKIKFGVLSTGEQGFWERPLQVVMKISQEKFTIAGNRKRRVKGMIDESKTGNYFVVKPEELLEGWQSISRSFQTKLI